MGGSRFNSNDWSAMSRNTQGKSVNQIFTSRAGHADNDPSKFKMRESRDSDVNPESTPIIIACDNTGSMGNLARILIQDGIRTIMEEIYSRKPVSDPHVCVASVGDSLCDVHPFQVTQFEAGAEPLFKQIANLYIEGGGGGNGGESYILTWYFALNKTACDSFKNRKRKGFIFTIGDESPHRVLSAHEVTRVFGSGENTNADYLHSEVCKEWEVFHIVTPTTTTESQHATEAWRKILHERVLVVDDWHKLPEVIVSTMQIVAGHQLDDVVSSWGDSNTQSIVRRAVSSLARKQEGDDLVVMQ